MAAFLVLTSLLCAAPEDRASLTREAVAAVSVGGDASRQCDIWLRAAEILGPEGENASVAATWLIRGLRALGSGDPALRAIACHTLEWLDEIPPPPTAPPGSWKEDAEARAFTALFRVDPGEGLALAEELGIGAADRARSLAESAIARAGGTPREDDLWPPPASARKALAMALDAGDEDLLALAVRAVVTCAPDGGASLLLEAGPVRQLASAARVALAPTTDAALAEARSLLDPAVRARALLDRASCAVEPIDRQALLGSATASSRLASDPAERSTLLLRCAALLGDKAEQASAAGEAIEAARATKLPRTRLRALAEAAAETADLAPEESRAALAEALTLARAETSAGDRWRALHDVLVRAGARHPEDAVAVLGELAGASPPLLLESLAAIAGAADTDARMSALRRARQVAQEWTATPSERARALEALPLRPTGQADALAELEQEVRRDIGSLLRERARAATKRSERVEYWIETAEQLASCDLPAAREAWREAGRALCETSVETGWLEPMLLRAQAISPELALEAARALPDPARSCEGLALLGVGDEATTVAARLPDRSQRVPILLSLAERAPSAAVLDALSATLAGLPADETRDAQALRAIDAVVLTELPDAQSRLEKLSGLLTSPLALASARAMAVYRFTPHSADYETVDAALKEAERLAEGASGDRDGWLSRYALARERVDGGYYRTGDAMGSVARARWDGGGTEIARQIVDPWRRARALLSLAEMCPPDL